MFFTKVEIPLLMPEVRALAIMVEVSASFWAPRLMLIGYLRILSSVVLAAPDCLAAEAGRFLAFTLAGLWTADPALAGLAPFWLLVTGLNVHFSS